MKYFKYVTVIILFFSICLAQFGDVTVKIETQNLKAQEKNDLEILQNQIKYYFEDHEWTANKYNIALPIRISLYIHKAQISSSERQFSGQLILVTDSNDLQLFEKKLNFNYNQNEALVHSMEIKSLATILDFYGYILLASEMDTYEPLGGSSLFEKARSLGSRAEMSSYSAGWTERLETLNELIELRYFRRYKYYFWHIIDMETNGNLKEIPEVIDEALINLEQELKINNRSRYLHLFLDAHAPVLADLLKLYGNKEQKGKIINLDPDNKTVYEEVFAK